MQIAALIVGAVLVALSLFVARNQSGDGSFIRWVIGVALGLAGLAAWFWVLNGMRILSIF